MTDAAISGPGLSHGHHLQQVSIRILEVEATPAPACVDLAVGMVVRPTAIPELTGLYPAKDGVELRVADMKGVMMAPARPRVETGPAPGFRLIGKVKCQTLVYLDLSEVAGLDC